MVIDDTFEHVLWEKGKAPKSKKDKPYRAWKRVRELCDGKTDLSHASDLKRVVEFAFKPFLKGDAISDTASSSLEHHK